MNPSRCGWNRVVVETNGLLNDPTLARPLISKVKSIWISQPGALPE